MKLIEMAKEIGREIQKEDLYLNAKRLEKKVDENKDLQELIKEFNLKRIAINTEVNKDKSDDEKLDELNKQMREAYKKIMEDENMAAYNLARQELDSLVKKVSTIIIQSSKGIDPETINLEESCGGDCSGCSGCH